MATIASQLPPWRRCWRVSQLRLAGQAVDDRAAAQVVDSDELGCLHLEAHRARLFSKCVPRYDNGSILITSNSRVVVTALLDRLLSPLDGGHHPGDSYRLSQKRRSDHLRKIGASARI
ncbi:hypothetical protein CO655_30865 [Rhizobium sp. M1]|nr:hypothetical protein CO655_30865 [Rhizobium sp. M1]